MSPATKKKLVATNAAIWIGGILASFILPMVAKGMTDGPGNFLQMLVHVGPLFVAMLFSTAAINKATTVNID